MFMDVISATLIIGPVFLPMLAAYGINPIHFGLLMTVNMAIGYCTPPVGVSLYITGAMVNKDLVWVSKAVIPFILIQMAVLALITYLPETALWLPRLLGYHQLIFFGGPARSRASGKHSTLLEAKALDGKTGWGGTANGF